jgi:hypothetical protein
LCRGSLVPIISDKCHAFGHVILLLDTILTSLGSQLIQSREDERSNLWKVVLAVGLTIRVPIVGRDSIKTRAGFASGRNGLCEIHLLNALFGRRVPCQNQAEEATRLKELLVDLLEELGRSVTPALASWDTCK